MAQWVKVFPANPDSLSSIPRSHMLEGARGLLKLVLWPPYVCSVCMGVGRQTPHQYSPIQINKCENNGACFLYVLICLCTCTCLGECLSQLPSTFVLWDRFLTEAGAHRFSWTSWTVSLRDAAVCDPSELSLQTHTATLASYMSTWDLNSGPSSHTAVTLLTEPSQSKYHNGLMHQQEC